MRRSGTVLAGALLLAASSGEASRARAAEPPQKAAAVDPAAIAALQKRGAFLQTLPAIQVHSEMTTDDVMPSGQKVQYEGTVELKVRRPDRLTADITSDRKNERIFYDGKTFTVYQPTLGYFAAFNAPATLRELVDVLETKYGVDLPLADLFRLGTSPRQISAIQGARMIGYSTIKGAVCAHYAFHQADVDWELWIQEGAQPLPRKLVITTLGDKTEPQHTSVMTWDLAPRLDEQTFVFAAPSNATRINFDVDNVAPGRQQGGAVNPRKEGTP